MEDTAPENQCFATENEKEASLVIYSPLKETPVADPTSPLKKDYQILRKTVGHFSNRPGSRGVYFRAIKASCI